MCTCLVRAAGVQHHKAYPTEDVYLEIMRYFGLEGTSLRRAIVSQIDEARKAEEDRRVYLPEGVLHARHGEVRCRGTRHMAASCRVHACASMQV